MLIKSRNVYIAHIAFLSDRINEIVERTYGARSKILFQQSTEISSFYYGKAKGWVWFLFYIAFLILVFVWFCYAVYLNFCANWPLAVVIIVEAIVAVSMYGALFATGGGIRSVRGQIEADYEKWLENCSQKDDQSIRQTSFD